MERVGPARVAVVLLEVAGAGGDSDAAPVVVKAGGLTVWYVVSVIFGWVCVWVLLWVIIVIERYLNVFDNHW